MSRPELLLEYEAALGGTLSDPWRSAIGLELELAVERARTEHPSYDVSDASFVRHVAALAGEGEDAAETISEIRHGDLFLALAAAQGDRDAVRDFDRLMAAEGPKALGRLRLDGTRKDEVLQRVRVRLLVGTESGKPKLLSFSGRGALGGWVRVATVNTAYNLLAEAGERPWAEADEALADVAATDNAELGALARRHAELLRASVRAALARIPDKERLVLRYKLVEELSIDQIKVILGVDRSTAARRFLRARQNLRDSVEKEFCERAGVTPTEFRTIARELYSLLEVSIERHLNG